MKNNIQKKYYDELNIFRALIIAWVVIGHSTEQGLDFLGFLHGYAYSFHMIAFFTLSGFLFEPKIKRCKDNTKVWLTTIGDRAKRLLVPYTFFTIISLILKSFFESYAFNELDDNPLTIITDFLLGQNNPNGGIWFLYALFLISLVAVITSKINSVLMLIATFATRILLIFVPISITPIDYIFRYSFVFFLGVVIKENYESISAGISKFKNKAIFPIIVIIAGIISVGIIYSTSKVGFSDIAKIIVSIYNTILWYLIAQLIDKSKLIKKWFMTIGDYGMDIYMVGYYVQISIRVVFMTMLGLPYVICSIMMFVFGLLLPIPISKYIIRKIGLFKALMLGDFSKRKVKNNGK